MSCTIATVAAKTAVAAGLAEAMWCA